MKVITIILNDELEKAIERHKQRFANSPTLDIVARRLLEECVGASTSAERAATLVKSHSAIRFPSGPKLEPLAHMVDINDGSCIAIAAIEDRR